MKINTVISTDILRKSRPENGKIQITGFAVIASALISGTLIYLLSRDYLTGAIWDAFTGFFTDFTSKTKTEVFSGLILSHFPYIILMLVLATSSVGYWLIPIVSFVKSMGLGVLPAYLYSSFGLRGIEYALLIFFPGKFIMILSMLLLISISSNNSLHVYKLTKGECSAENLSSVFAVKIIISVLLFVLSALVDCFLAISFSPLFDF